MNPGAIPESMRFKSSLCWLVCLVRSPGDSIYIVLFSSLFLDNSRIDFDKDCEDPEYKPLQGPPKDPEDEVRTPLECSFYLLVGLISFSEP